MRSRVKEGGEREEERFNRACVHASDPPFQQGDTHNQRAVMGLPTVSTCQHCSFGNKKLEGGKDGSSREPQTKI